MMNFLKKHLEQKGWLVHIVHVCFLTLFLSSTYLFYASNVYSFGEGGAGGESNCSDGQDNDSDSYTDSDDSECLRAPGIPDMTASTDLGSSSTDNITSDNTPDFTVSCDPFTVKLYIDGDYMNVVGSGGCSGGTVTITTATLGDGTHTITATQTGIGGSATGLESTASDALSVTVDTTAPTAPGVPDLQAGSDTGFSSTDDLTNDNTMTFDISCEGGATVDLREGVVAHNAGVCSGGSVSLASAGVPGDYTHSFFSRQTDVAGNVSGDSSALAVTISTTAWAGSSPDTASDLDAGVDSGSSNTDDITNNTNPTFTSPCTSGYYIYVYSDDSLPGATACVSNSVTYSAGTLTSNNHTIITQFGDVYGNLSSASPSLSVTIDTTAPTTSGAPDMTTGTDLGSSSADDITSDDTPDFTGACTDGNTVGLSSGGSAACSSSTFSITTGALASGSNSITFNETDAAGNSSSASTALSVTIDTTAPVFSSVTPATSASINNVTSSSDISFTSSESLGSGSTTATRTSGTDGNSPHICTLKGTALNSGAHTLDLSDTTNSCTSDVSNLVSGAVYTFRFSGADTAGNYATVVSNTGVTFDTTSPSAPTSLNLAAGSDSGSSSTDDITSDTTPDISISCESGDTVSLKESSTVLGTGTCSGSAVTITSSTLSGEGAHALTATQADAAGNSSDASTSFDITIDTTAPTTSGGPDLATASDPGSSTGDNLTNDTTPTLVGACTDGNIVTLYDDGVATGSTATCSGSVFSITGTAVTATSIITFKETDPAGNISGASNSLTVTIDTAVPVIAAIDDTVTSTEAVITWTDNENASSTIQFDASSNYTDATTEYDSSGYVQSNSFTLDDLLPCSTYHYRILSYDEAGNVTTSADQSITTAGCLGNATIGDSDLLEMNATDGGTLAVDDASITVPDNYMNSDTEAVFQMKELDSDQFFVAIDEPSGFTPVGDSVIDMKAFLDSTTLITSFLEPITVTIKYNDTDIGSLDESTLTIYRYDGSAWYALTGCSVDASANTVSCPTTAFSSFSIFGSQSSSSSGAVVRGTSSGGSMPASYFGTSSTTNALNLASSTSKLSFIPANFSFLRTLTLGAQGTDVKILQKLLNSLGFTIAKTGPGSPSNETTFFGLATKAALAKFQVVHNINPPLGFFGPVTRTYINSLLKLRSN